MEAGASTFTFYSSLSSDLSGKTAKFVFDPIDMNSFLNKTMYAKKYQVRLKDFSFTGQGFGDIDDDLILDSACYLDGIQNTNQFTISSADVNNFQLPVSTLTILSVISRALSKGNAFHYIVNERRDSSCCADLIVDRGAFEGVGRILKPVVSCYLYKGETIWFNVDFHASLILEITPIY